MTSVTRVAALLTAVGINLVLAGAALATDYVVDVRGDDETGYVGIIINRETGEAVDWTPKVRKRKARALKDAHDRAVELEEESGGDGVVDNCIFRPETCINL